MKTANSESGSALPLLIGAIFVLMLFLFFILSIAEMTAERSRQQSSADLAALAGANAIGKSIETARIIDGTIWIRNATLDAMYLAATVATLGSAGAGAEAFAVPLEFQKATIGPVETLEKTKGTVSKAAIFYAAANSARIIKANGSNDYGAAVPFPLVSRDDALSQRQKDLTKMIRTYDSRIDQAKGEMEQAVDEYEQKKSVEAGADADVRRALDKVRETSGRVGGLTTQRNRRRKELANSKRLRPFALGRDGVVAVLYHPSSNVGFGQVFGRVETGNNVALAAATMVDGPPTETIGEEAVKRLLAHSPSGSKGAMGIDRLTDAVNLWATRANDLPNTYGPLGGYLLSALDRLELVPPPLNEVRPALTSINEVAGEAASSVLRSAAHK